MDPNIQVQNISKVYRKGGGLPGLRSIFSRNYKLTDNRYHWAVKDLNFNLYPGQALGVIGPNGAGKTTVLKMLSRVTRPTSGSISVKGRLSALIELGAGFHPDLSGRENIYLNGIILGMKRAEIASVFDQIVDFSGVEAYLDTPVKRYSSGMYARLGFSIAAHVRPEILLVDEVLAVGDYAFQVKCHAHMDKLREQGTSLIFVSHNMDAVRRVCDLGLVMFKGQPIFQGSAQEAVIAYSDAVRDASREMKSEVPTEGGLAERVMTFDAEILRVWLTNKSGELINVVSSGQIVTFNLDVSFKEDVDHPIFALAIRTPDGYRVYATTTKWLNIVTPKFKKGDQWQITFEMPLPLLDGTYDVSVNIGSNDLSHYYDRHENAMSFQVTDSAQAKGVVDLAAKVDFSAQPVQFFISQE